MQAILIINGTDFSHFLRASGLQQIEISRQSRSVEDLNGTSYRTEIIKRGLSVGLRDLRDDTWYRLMAALQNRPAVVRYIDDRLGDCTKQFYVTNPTSAAKTVRGGHTYFTGGTFELEEK